MKNKFQCLLMGDRNLLAQCGELLLNHGHQIVAVYTADVGIELWAKKQGLTVLTPSPKNLKKIKLFPIDYFFSIANLRVVPDEILALPKRGAINFHDGPLPHYRGLFTPVWALLNEEPRYGITWHLMTNQVDRGDVLKSKALTISPEETSLSLNTKCFEAAMESFEALIEELSSGTHSPQAQPDQSGRNFGKYDRPQAACTLNWEQPAGKLNSVVKALDFGAYENAFASAKVLVRDKIFLVAQSRSEPGAGVPGEVTQVDGAGLKVATRDGILCLNRWQTPFGNPVSGPQLEMGYGLQKGTRLPLLDSLRAEKLTALQVRFLRWESFWVRRFQKFTPMEPSHPEKGNSHQRPKTRRIPIQVPQAFKHRFNTSPWVNLIAGFAAFAGKWVSKSRFHLGYSSHMLRREITGLEPWIAGQIPLAFNLQSTPRWESFTGACEREIAKVQQRGSWFSDLVARYPRLDHLRPLEGRLFPLAVATETSAFPFHLEAGNQAALVLDEENRQFELAFSVHLAEEDMAHWAGRFEGFLQQLAGQQDVSILGLDVLSPDERQKLLVQWNRTSMVLQEENGFPWVIERQAQQTPDAIALVSGRQTLTYKTLLEKSLLLAGRLRRDGIQPDQLVAIHLTRKPNLVIAILGVGLAGGAYLPLDPAYPGERIHFMLADSAVSVVITEPGLGGIPQDFKGNCISLSDPHAEESLPGDKQVAFNPIPSQHLAYAIYTSGSTGKPKGVMVTHANVLNFMAAMDRHIPHTLAGTWLAVTSLSFDISVLELVWTLSHGFKVLLQDQTGLRQTKAGVDFSLFYFSSSDAQTGKDKYRLLLDGARFADTHDFKAVWTPERHFHAFGGLYPNPAVTGAAVAAVTERVEIRAGSVVLPLHHPVRVAEEWSVVDNLSGGRVGISVASGWQPNDFLLRPENFADAKAVMFREIETLQALWRGDRVEFPGATGKPVSIHTMPRPMSKALPIWVTTAGNPETYRQAGEIGAHILTHLLGQSAEELAPKIALYREARKNHGFDPQTGIVTLMLHSFVGQDQAAIKNLVKEPLKAYLGSSLNLLKKYASAFPAFTGPKHDPEEAGEPFENLTEEERDALLEGAFERYFQTSGLFGKPEACVQRVERLRDIGVNEIACLIDFGVDAGEVLQNLPHLNRLRQMVATGKGDPIQSETLTDLMQKHRVSHFQCTPSMLQMLMSPQTRPILNAIPHFYLGGEACPGNLAQNMAGNGNLCNLYGPTETTIWSAVYPCTKIEDPLPLGRPVANTAIYVLDPWLCPVAPGRIGELFIGGSGVVRGYLNRPSLTAARFLPNPFEEGQTLYRTGDLGSIGADGQLRFSGRCDQQVKIRGHRIELGEIESHLNSHPEIKEAVVLAKADATGNHQLVGYFIADATAPAAETLKKYLKSRIPAHMIPDQFAQLDQFPLTPNSKIDRNGFPSVDQLQIRSKVAYVAPANDLEERITSLWQQILGRKQVGIDHNFFDSGGHSLLVVRMHRRLETLIGRPISLTDLYQYTTVRSLADFLQSGESDKALSQSKDRANRRLASRGRRR